MAILVTGGTGYIGVHTCVELLHAGDEVVIIDNLSNSKLTALQKLKEITGKEVDFYQVDILDKKMLEKVFLNHKIETVIHLAGLKAVSESIEVPLNYYENNIAGTLVLLQLMKKYNVKQMVFSSSATVYGVTKKVPLNEQSPLSAINPYGRTKLFIEKILFDLYHSDPTWKIAILRYFNPIGAHPSGKIGEDPQGIPNNLLPFVTQVASGKLDELVVFGSDYPTPDGTCIRDYIHVVDLAKGHLRAMEKLRFIQGIDCFNLGTGKGYSVFEIISTFEKVTGVKVSYTLGERRPGDAAVCIADPMKAKQILGWSAEKDLEDMCRDAWRWQQNNM